MRQHVTPQLVLLIGAPPHDQISMHHDLIAMYEAWRRRGLSTEQILSLEGKLDRPLVLDLLAAVRRRIATWREGTLFIYVAGHGFFYG